MLRGLESIELQLNSDVLCDAAVAVKCPARVEDRLTVSVVMTWFTSPVTARGEWVYLLSKALHNRAARRPGALAADLEVFAGGLPGVRAPAQRRATTFKKK